MPLQYEEMQYHKGLTFDAFNFPCRMKFFQFFVFSTFIILVSCNYHPKEKTIDYPAYHNPTVQGLTDSIAANPVNASFYFQRSVALSQINNDSLALMDLYKAVKLDSLNAIYYNAIGYVEMNLNHPEKAVVAFQKSLKIKPTDVTTRIDLANAQLAAHNIQEAEAVLNHVLKIAPAYAPALLMQARLFVAKKDTSDAIQTVKNILEKEPDYYDASMQLADWYNEEGNEEAVMQYQKTFQLDSTDAAPLYEIGRFYKKKKKWEKSKQAFANCFITDKDYTYAYINLAEILIQQDSLQKAQRLLKIAIHTEPTNSDAWFLAGNCFEKLQLKDSAKVYYNQAAVFGYSEKEIREAMKRIQ